ncbi:hypothetical protein Cgig2_018789 [Carnegiea gigantea]|uniref:Uncharacterized protein n=1 Tax=Carnegiea gigantea TaxID=171969 RepID=A0A9Q1K8D3_9CARY|nr:hypothetical protein Cgig2_018789 [Carnegiea gigantea]
MHGELKTGSKSEVGEEQNWKRKLERKGVVLVVGQWLGQTDVNVICKCWSGEATTCEGCCVRIKSARYRSGGKCNDGEEVGEERSNNEAGVKRNSRSLGVEGGELLVSRLHLGGNTIEISDDDEISVASMDAGDEEATKEDDAGDERAAEKQCGDGNKTKGSADGNDINDNVWPRSGMEARSYHRKLSIWKKFQDFVYFTVYGRHAAEIFPNLLPHTHYAGIEYHARHCAKPGVMCTTGLQFIVYPRLATEIPPQLARRIPTTQAFCTMVDTLRNPACCGDTPELASTYPLRSRSVPWVMCATGLQFIVYPQPAAEIPPNLQAHTHRAGIQYCGRHCTKSGVMCAIGLQFIMYPQPAAEIPPDLQAHTHCAAILHHGLCVPQGCNLLCIPSLLRRFPPTCRHIPTAQFIVYPQPAAEIPLNLVMCATGLQFIVYPQPAAEIPPNLQAHTHCACVLYHGRHCMKSGIMCATGLQFIVYPQPATEIPPNLQAHTHCAGVLYHGTYSTKPGLLCIPDLLWRFSSTRTHIPTAQALCTMVDTVSNPGVGDKVVARLTLTNK